MARSKGLAQAHDAHGFTALHYGARLGHANVVRRLLDCGADVDAPTRGLGATPLMRALVGRHPAVVALLLDRNAALGSRNADNEDAALLAAASDDLATRTAFFGHPRLRLSDKLDVL
ncbi:Ankyrin repeat domain-containing protein 39 [Physocladia obscura]|uniref:protein S-acyltransferase n=1 Tax=Physocladia obscura TaxID=109957 RepID=A0AAD5TDK9_9FUNG|nr:Ankyrin repeat domain-containing protein 39 [Physocladia obscura]